MADQRSFAGLVWSRKELGEEKVHDESTILSSGTCSSGTI